MDIELRKHDVDTDDYSLESGGESIEQQEPWQRQKAEWTRQLRDTSPATFPRIGLLLSGGLATLCILIAGATLFLFQSNKNPSHPPSVPHMLAEFPWTPSMSGLKNNSYFPVRPHSTSLGSNLVVLDVDTRPWQIENPANMSQLTWGRLNHYLYAQMHGYDYKFVRAPAHAGLHATWAKVQAVRDVLQQGYQYVVFTDSDVIFPHLKIPMEYLLNHWNVTADIALTLGYAPNITNRYDRTHHKLIVNTGFMVVQNTSVTDRMLKDWVECPSDIKYPGCSHWKEAMWHEQSAYSDYIRYDYANATREVLCNEVNGAPDKGHGNEGSAHCDGIFVRHYWVAKNKVKEAVQASIAELALPTVVEDLMSKWASPQ